MRNEERRHHNRGNEVRSTQPPWFDANSKEALIEFVADDVADDCGHFDNAEEFRPSRSVALARMACRIEERRDRNASNIVD